MKIKGWAIESRIYAEDPYRNFLPSIGRLRRYLPPEEGKFGDILVRNDAGVREGDEISMFYDPMIAKLVTHGPTRLKAIDAQARALDSFLIEGIQDNIPFLGAVMDEKTFRSGDFTTAYIKEQFPDGFNGTLPEPHQRDLLAAVAAFAQSVKADRARKVANGSAPKHARTEWVVIVGREQIPAKIHFEEGGAEITFAGKKAAHLKSAWVPGQPVMIGEFAGQPFAVKIKDHAEGYVLRLRGVKVKTLVCSPRAAELHAKLPEKVPADTSKMIISPMPGLVVAIEVSVGQEVKVGESVAIVEAMKMQNIIRAERDGVVKAVNVEAGASVAADEVLVEID